MIGILLGIVFIPTQTHAAEESSKEPIMMAYYRTWRDATMPSSDNSNLPDQNVTAMTDIPEGVDIVSVFHYVKSGTDQQKFWATLKNTYIPTLHARGTAVGIRWVRY